MVHVPHLSRIGCMLSDGESRIDKVAGCATAPGMLCFHSTIANPCTWILWSVPDVACEYGEYD